MVKLKGLAYKQRSLLNLAVGLLVLFVLNLLSSSYFARFDLTSEKRYTLAEVSKDVLKELDKPIFVEVYLEGDLPSGFKRLQSQTRELLEEFQAYSDNIQFHIVNPLSGQNPQQQQQILHFLADKGLQATDLQVKTLEGTEQKLIIPGAILGNGEYEIALSLLNNQIGVPPETILNNSVQSLEYELINAIRKLSRDEKFKVGLLSGHGELDYPYIVDLALALDKDYNLYQPIINGDLNVLLADDKPRFNALIIAKPTQRFTEQDKFVIDQFVMHGGNVLWLIDPVRASMDSLLVAEQALAFPFDLNLEDMLFNYGVRINSELILDMNALPIPLRTGQIGNQPQIEFFPWPFYPILNPIASHPIVRNLNAIKSEFISSIDTIAVPDIKKTILLQTSNYSSNFSIPNTISLNIINERKDASSYQLGPQNVAVLYEGAFKSVFKNRIPPIELNGFSPKEKSVASMMIFIADGDMVKNLLHSSSREPLPLGYDQYNQQFFGNKDFILNAVSYLCDGGEFINLRSREIKLRLLNKAKIKEEAMKWKIVNVLLPIIFIVLFGIVYSIYRKRKYSLSNFQHSKSN